MLLGIQIIGALFGIFMIYIVFVKSKRQEFTAKETILWMFMWAVFVVVSIFPFILDPFTKSLKIVRTFDLLVILGVIFLVGLTYYNYTIIRSTQKKLTDLVKHLAIEKAHISKSVHKKKKQGIKKVSPERIEVSTDMEQDKTQ